MHELVAYGVELVPIRSEHLELVRSWRNHPEVAEYMLNNEKISSDDQQQWFRSIDNDPEQQHFLVHYKKLPIAVINIKSLDQQSLQESDDIEVGMYMAPDSRYRGTVAAFMPALVINDYCFEGLGCRRLKAVILANNGSALRFNHALGYKEVDDYSDLSEKGELIYMSMDKLMYEEAKVQLKKVIRF